MLNFKIFNKPPESQVYQAGLDIGTSSIKLVRLKSSEGSFELCDFELLAMQPDPTALLKQIKQSHGLNRINIGVSGPSTVIRYVDFPMIEATQLKQALKFEAQRHIPFPVEEVNLDGCILKEGLPDNKMLVLLAAAKNELIEQRLRLFKEAQVPIGVVDMDSLALINAFNHNYSPAQELKGKAIALLNMGALFSNLNILENGTPRFSRDIHIAGNHFTQKIMDTFAVDFVQAENLKLNPPKEETRRLIAAVESALANLASEIRTSFDFYESQAVCAIEKIFLSGGSIYFSGLKDMLANLLGMEVEVWDPLRRINLAQDIDQGKIKSLSSQLAISIGLALRT
jgi:type IV pilus assembly protein PilM